MTDNLTKAVRAARIALDKAEALAAAETNKLNEQIRAGRGQEAERDELRIAEDNDEASRLLDPDDGPPIDAARRKRLAELDRAIPARGIAIGRQRQRVASAQEAVKAAQTGLVDPTLAIVEAMQGEALESIRAALKSLQPALAKLVASDQVRRAVIGDNFPVRHGQSVPIGGLIFSQSLIKALPQRCLCPELSEAEIFPIAATISGEVIATIKGK